MADGRTALSQHRRRAHAKRRGRRRISFLLVTTLTALVAIAAGLTVEIVRTSSGGGTDPTAAALATIPDSHAAALLEQQRQQLILEDSAAKTLSLVGKPKLATRPLQSSGTPGSSSNPSSSTGGGPTTAVSSGPPPPPPTPGSNQSIAFNMMGSFGFSTSTQFSGCLVPLWNQESGWNQFAENASGAYGIPQALPFNKMPQAAWPASAGGSSSPSAQIGWGLGYIKSTYGTPCNAWGHEQSFGWY
jgi:hypothetical protein